MGENSSHPEMLIESNIAISIVWYIFIFNSMKTMGFECFPLPYRIFQFAGEFIIGVPPKSDYYWIKTLPCYSIKDRDSNPKSRSLPLFLKCISFSLFYTEWPVPLPVCSLPAPPPAIKIYHWQKPSRNNNWLFNINLDFSGNLHSRLPVFVSPSTPQALVWACVHHLQEVAYQRGN